LELLLVVTIILILAAIAIPRYWTVRQHASTTAAVSNLRSLNTALAAYASAYPSVGYPASLTALGPTTSTPSSTAANLVDDSLANSSTTLKQGYIFAYTSGGGAAPVESYTIQGTPSVPYAYRYFYSDASCTIRYNDSQPATSGSPPIT
jgi:type II secretory pathway pseudopilin PulG